MEYIGRVSYDPLFPFRLMGHNQSEAEKIEEKNSWKNYESRRVRRERVRYLFMSS